MREKSTGRTGACRATITMTILVLTLLLVVAVQVGLGLDDVRDGRWHEAWSAEAAAVRRDALHLVLRLEGGPATEGAERRSTPDLRAEAEGISLRLAALERGDPDRDIPRPSDAVREAMARGRGEWEDRLSPAILIASASERPGQLRSRAVIAALMAWMDTLDTAVRRAGRSYERHLHRRRLLQYLLQATSVALLLTLLGLGRRLGVRVRSLGLLARRSLPAMPTPLSPRGDDLDLVARTFEDQATLSAVVEAVPVGLVAFDAEGRLAFVNSYVETDLGMKGPATLAEWIERYEFRHPDGSRVTLETAPAWQTLRDGQPRFGRELRLHHEDGRVTPLLVDAAPVRDRDGAARMVVTVLTDLSERKKAEDLQARLLHADRLVSIGQLAAGVAHEVNNPAAYVMANTEMSRRYFADLSGRQRDLRAVLAEEVDEATLSRIAERISLDAMGEVFDDLEEMASENREGVDRIRSIVRDLRNFGRLDQDEVGEVDLHEVVGIAANMVHPEIRHRARLVKALEDVPLIVGDRGKLAQVVVNLLVNAAHAIPEGEAEANRITVAVRRIDDVIEVAVEDTGAGIPPEDLPRIFEPFFTTKPRDRGTGLGLPLCRDIAALHGGTIEVESTLGKGSRFVVRLPTHTGLRPAGAVPEASPGPARERRLRILLIDDEAAIRSAFRRLLSPPHEVVEAADGRAALARLEADAGFDLILCDLIMPDVDGPAVHEAVAERWPELIERLVVCTGGAFTERSAAFLERVPVRVLEKPVTPVALLELVRSVAGSSGKSRAAG